MSSTSEDVIQPNERISPPNMEVRDFHSEIDYLMLDLGLYATSEKLRESMVNQQAINPKTIKMDLNTEPMSDADWDIVLDNVLKAKRCITL